MSQLDNGNLGLMEAMSDAIVLGAAALNPEKSRLDDALFKFGICGSRRASPIYPASATEPSLYLYNQLNHLDSLPP